MKPQETKIRKCCELMRIKNQPLEGELVRLEPIDYCHIEPLQTAVSDGDLWTLWYARVPQPDAMAEYVELAKASALDGNIAYVVVDKSNNQVVGTTRYYNVESTHRRASIGYTWYAKKVQRTAVNTEAKFLLLQNAFESSEALSVTFVTHYLNTKSRAAIERLGAKLDGILRSHQVMADGSVRDSAIYSILANEWPTVKNNLTYKLKTLQ